MDEHVEEMDNRLKRTKFSLRRLHNDINLILGLHSLLHLQYLHEGHIDGHVYQELDTRLFNFEVQLSEALGRLHVDDLPF